ncbi:MAG: kynureninase [Chloroflexota bacterium]
MSQSPSPDHGPQAADYQTSDFSKKSDVSNLHSPTTLDATDPLARFADRFYVDDPDLIYMLANSLGRLPRATAARMQELVAEEWGARLIRGWNEGWIELPQKLGDKLARLLGARPGEVVIADSTSVNLYKVVRAALDLRPDRRKILTDDLNFPSDLYILQGALGDRHLQVVPSPDGIHGPVGALQEALDEDTALLALSHTAFKSSYVYDMVSLTRRAHEAGALVVWDLSHSAGAVAVDLQEARADFAVGCTYKYLSGGPGAPAFLYVRSEHQERARNPVSGWMGQARPFDFDLEYQPAPGLRRFLSGTPAILSLAAIEPGLDLLLEAGMERVRAKSVQQTSYLIALWQEILQPLGFQLRSPLDDARRGSHVALGHPEAMRISLALKQKMNVLPDFRAPDNLRLSVAPLYTGYAEIYEAVQRIAAVVEKGLYEAFPTEAPEVT